MQKIKILKSGTKDARFRMKKCLNLGPKIPDLGIFALEFENNIVTFEISTLKFVYLRNFTEKKYLNSGPKMPDLGMFGLEFNNNIVMLEIHALDFA